MPTLIFSPRKGEVIKEEGDKRTRSEKQQALKQIHKEKFSNPFWQSEAIKFIKWKIKEFESRGNYNKAAIYRAKLKGKHGRVRKSASKLRPNRVDQSGING